MTHDDLAEWLEQEFSHAVSDEPVNKLAEALAKEIKVQAPKKSGALANSVIARGDTVVVQVKYAWLIHQGTRPHIIRPRFKKALYWKGARHPVRKVNKPGTKANPFVDRAIEITLRKFDKK